MRQLRQSGARLSISGRDLDTVQWRLENLVGPHQERDYGNVSAALEALRALAYGATTGPSHTPSQLARLG
jgi:hypothetical protein